MRVRRVVECGVLWAGMYLGPLSDSVGALPAGKPAAACRRAAITGELRAGEVFRKPFGAGLEVYFQPIASGWILRVVPVGEEGMAHDYAELATPPYESVTPLSISTDFAFRAQDAVGWNPRRFHFATSAESYKRLEEAYFRLEQAGATPPAPLQVDLSAQIAQASEGTFTILDARLVPGMADQWKMAGAVASHFSTTAHTVVESPDGKTSALGRLVWLRFRLDLDLPPGFRPDSRVQVVPRTCGGR